MAFKYDYFCFWLYSGSVAFGFNRSVMFNSMTSCLMNAVLFCFHVG